MPCKLFTRLAQSSAPENIGPERTRPAHLAPGPVNSPSRITPENNEELRAPPAAENSSRGSCGGAVRRMRTRLGFAGAARSQIAQRPRHSAKAAARFRLWVGRLERWRSVLKRLWIEAWTAANVCRLRRR